MSATVWCREALGTHFSMRTVSAGPHTVSGRLFSGRTKAGSDLALWTRLDEPACCRRMRRAPARHAELRKRSQRRDNAKRQGPKWTPGDCDWSRQNEAPGATPLGKWEDFKGDSNTTADSVSSLVSKPDSRVSVLLFQTGTMPMGNLSLFTRASKIRLVLQQHL